MHYKLSEDDEKGADRLASLSEKLIPMCKIKIT